MAITRPFLRPALFLDRDGVINFDEGYVCRREDFVFLEGIFDIARDAHAAGFVIIVVTNQSGIGRGYYSETQFLTLTEWMCRQFANAGAPVSAVYHCPFHQNATNPDLAVANHPWRKPNPGMLLAAAEEHALSMEQSLMIGDRMSDLRAATRVNLAMCCLIGDHIDVLEDLGNTRLVLAASVAALATNFAELLAELRCSGARSGD